MCVPFPLRAEQATERFSDRRAQSRFPRLRWRRIRAKKSSIADPEAAAKAAAEGKRRADEARAAWEQAHLPPDLAALRALQRLAGETNEVTVITEGN